MLILLFQFFNQVYLASHAFEARILFFEHQKLLLNVHHSTFTVEVEDVFQMLHFFLKLHHQFVVRSAYLVGLNFHHDLLRPVCEL